MKKPAPVTSAKVCPINGCGKPAPFGFRLPGHRKDLPPNRRGYLWVCADHREEGAARQEAAIKARGVG